MPFPRPLHAVVFDLDGLLIDSEKPVRAASLAVAERLGRPMTADFYATLIGRPYPAVAARLAAHFGDDALLASFTAEFRAALAGSQPFALMAGVLALLDQVDAAGLPTAVCTSSGRERARAKLAATGVLERFPVLVTGDDVTRGKPAPDPYCLAAERLGVAAHHCLALEDSHTGVQSAHAAGMMVVMVPDVLPCTEAIRPLCLHVADGLGAVGRLIAAAAGPAEGGSPLTRTGTATPPT